MAYRPSRVLRDGLWHMRARRDAIRSSVRNVSLGPSYPQWGEQIWVDPKSVHSMYRSYDSARVIHQDLLTEKLSSQIKIQAVYDHFTSGLSWEETGIFDFLLAEIARLGSSGGAKSRDDLEIRYQKIDLLFADVKRRGLLLSTQEAHCLGVARSGRRYRAWGDIGIHILPNGPCFSGSGHHRLAIAQILSVPLIPARLGVVHSRMVEAFRYWDGRSALRPKQGITPLSMSR